MIKQRLVAFDPESRSLAYAAVEGMPSFVERALNRWSVHPHGEQACLVRTHATLELRGPMRLLSFWLQRRLRADGTRMLEELH